MKKLIFISLFFVYSIFPAENVTANKNDLLANLYKHELYQEFLRIFSEDFEVYDFIKKFDHNRHSFNLIDRHKEMIQIFYYVHNHISHIIGRYQRGSINPTRRHQNIILSYTSLQLLNEIRELTCVSNNRQTLMVQELRKKFNSYPEKIKLKETAKLDVDILVREIRFLQYEPSSGMPLGPLF